MLNSLNHLLLKTFVKCLEESKGIIVQDDLAHNIYPTPLQAKNKDEVFVGRIRQG